MKLFLPLLFLASLAPAAIISAISVTNNSTPDYPGTPTGNAEFRSANLGTTSDSTGFRNQFGWFFGQLAAGELPDGVDLSFELSFTVDTTSDYLLFITPEYFGHVYALHESGTGSIDLLLTDFVGSVYRGSDLVGTLDLLSGYSGSVNSGSPAINDPHNVFGSGPFDLQSSTYTYTIQIAAHMSLSYLAGDTGEAGFHFGLLPTVPGFTVPDEAGGLGYVPANSGLFLNVLLFSSEETDPDPDPDPPPSTVPEPATLWTSGIALLGLAATRSARRQ